MVISILLAFLVFVAIGAAAVTACRIYSQRRIRKAQEKVYQDYLREQAILEQNYFATYFAMLQAAEEQKKKTQNQPMSMR